MAENLLQRANSPMSPLTVPTESQASGSSRIAVLLNAQARKVTPRIVRALSHVVPRADLYLSRSPIDARRIAQAVLRRGYHTVFCGGGDGTFIGFADEILTEAEAARAAAPRFGVLELGTGNGVASHAQAQGCAGGGQVDGRQRAGVVGFVIG